LEAGGIRRVKGHLPEVIVRPKMDVTMAAIFVAPNRKKSFTHATAWLDRSRAVGGDRRGRGELGFAAPGRSAVLCVSQDAVCSCCVAATDRVTRLRFALWLVVAQSSTFKGKRCW